MKRYIQCAEQSNGVFWVIDGELFAFPFYEGYSGNGVAKSGSTFNHEKLWPEIAPKFCRNKSFDYYPRGRVQLKNDGSSVIYMNPNIDESMIPEIKRQFGLRSDPEIHLDNSIHYRCHLDDGYIASKKNRR